MVAKGFKTGGRKPLSEAGTAVPVRYRFPRELVQDLEEMAAALKRTTTAIVRQAVAAEVRKWKRRTGRT
jgi:predicted transcriptional regulator